MTRRVMCGVWVYCCTQCWLGEMLCGVIIACVMICYLVYVCCLIIYKCLFMCVNVTDTLRLQQAPLTHRQLF